MLKLMSVGAAILLLVACHQEENKSTVNSSLNDLAEEYLVLELAMGEVSPGHVDAYFGPDPILARAREAGLDIDTIGQQAADLYATLDAWDAGENADEQARIDGLLARITALQTRIALQRGEAVPFDEEIRRQFATSLAPVEADHFDSILAEIDTLVPGDGPLNERVDAYLDTFNIPADKLAEVIDAAIAECKRRTVEFIELPANESFTVEYVNNQPWGGYNWYKGKSHSLIQINTDFPSRINSAVTLGCHEGYPGHHVYNTLLEHNMVNRKGWVEFSLYPLFSPQSLIAEGSANYGINLAFPGEERVEFEKSVLFPLAGLDPEKAEDFYRLMELTDQLNFARNEAARDYLNGTKDAEQTVEVLMKNLLLSKERAEQSLRFIETYRSYVINYNHGRSMVADYIERDTDNAADRWARFEFMLSNSLLPRDLEP